MNENYRSAQKEIFIKEVKPYVKYLSGPAQSYYRYFSIAASCPKGIDHKTLEVLIFLTNHHDEYPMFIAKDIAEPLGRTAKSIADSLKFLCKLGMATRDVNQAPMVYQLTQKGIDFVLDRQSNF